MSKTKIEWTEETWNPTTGCDKTSPGCDNCYALGMAKRLKAMGQAKYQADGDPRTSGPGFALTVHPDTLSVPLRWKTPRRVFVNSMSDLFHVGVPNPFIVEVFDVMAAAQRHTFQVLTKRSQRMMRLLNDLHFASEWGYAVEERLDGDGDCDDPGELLRLLYGQDVRGHFGRNIWLGVSIESERYRFRLDHLRETPAAVRWVSFEPLLGPVGDLDLTGIDWVVVGGESGKGARPMHPDWAREIRDQCVMDLGNLASGKLCPDCDGLGNNVAVQYQDGSNPPCLACDGVGRVSVPFFFKQWGNWRESHDPHDDPNRVGTIAKGQHLSREGELSHYRQRMGETALMVRERSKNFDGHDLLDGQSWLQYPETRR